MCHQVVLDHWKSRPAAAVSHELQLLKYSDGLNVYFGRRSRRILGILAAAKNAEASLKVNGGKTIF